MPKNPFGDEETGRDRVNPFGSESAEIDAPSRLEHAARKMRMLRRQVGTEGLPAAAARELLDELSAALDAAARALREPRG